MMLFNECCIQEYCVLYHYGFESDVQMSEQMKFGTDYLYFRVKAAEMDDEVSIGQLGESPMLTVGVGEVKDGHNQLF